ncbi:MAG: hypothetical protein AB1746_17745, partial [Candidatus Zixiibacteriota bacterium]
ALFTRIFLNPVNWLRLFSPYFDRSDLAAEYYDKHVFDGGTFGDIANRKGPMILINATDMITGIRLAFNQDIFDAILFGCVKIPCSSGRGRFVCRADTPHADHPS